MELGKVLVFQAKDLIKTLKVEQGKAWKTSKIHDEEHVQKGQEEGLDSVEGTLENGE